MHYDFGACVGWVVVAIAVVVKGWVEEWDETRSLKVLEPESGK